MVITLANVKEELEKTRPSFEELAIDKTAFSRELEWAYQAIKGNDYLLKMEPQSLRNSLVNLAMTGLTLNPVLKMAYLVPRKMKCCVDPSYMGLMKLITDTGSVVSIKAKPVYENEPFDIEQGTNGFVKHSICKTGNKGKRIGAYSIAVLNDGSNHVEWMYEEQLQDIKKRSESVKKGKASPWDTDEDEMIRKTVIKRHWKFLPKSDRMQLAAQAIAFDDENNGIDFEAEKAEMDQKAKKAAQNPNSTPDAPFESALATDEDFEKIFELLADTNLGEFFISQSKLTIKALKAKMEKQKEGGTFEKSKAEEYIQFLKWEINEAKKKAAAAAEETAKA